MKKKIAILGSTGSIGQSSLEVLRSNLRKFEIILLSANSNYSLIIKQIQKYKPEYFIVNDKSTFIKILKKYKKGRTKIYNNFSDIPSKIKFDITIFCYSGYCRSSANNKFYKKKQKSFACK